MITTEKILDEISEHSTEEKSMIAEIVSRWANEERRMKIRQSADEAIAAYRNGELKPQTTDELFEEIGF